MQLFVCLYMSHQPTNLITNLPTKRLTNWPTDWLSDQLTDQLIDWPTNWPNIQLTNVTNNRMQIQISITVHFLEKYKYSGLVFTGCSGTLSLDEEKDDQELFVDFHNDTEQEDSKL